MFLCVPVVVQSTRQRAPPHLLRNNSNISIIPRNSPVARGLTPVQKPMVRLLGPNKDKPWAANKQPIATAKPYFGESPAHPPVTVSSHYSLFWCMFLLNDKIMKFKR